MDISSLLSPSHDSIVGSGPSTPAASGNNNAINSTTATTTTTTSTTTATPTHSSSSPLLQHLQNGRLEPNSLLQQQHHHYQHQQPPQQQQSQPTSQPQQYHQFSSSSSSSHHNTSHHHQQQQLSIRDREEQVLQEQEHLQQQLQLQQQQRQRLEETQSHSQNPSAPSSPHQSNIVSPKSQPRVILQARSSSTAGVTNPATHASTPPPSSLHFRPPDAKRPSLTDGSKFHTFAGTSSSPIASPPPAPVRQQSNSTVRHPSISSQRNTSTSSRVVVSRNNSIQINKADMDARRPSTMVSRTNSLADITARSPPDPANAPPSLFFEEEDEDEEIPDTPAPLGEVQIIRIGELMDKLESLANEKDADNGDVPTFNDFAECIGLLRQGYLASNYDPSYEYRNMLQEERERMLDSYPMTEEMWLQWLDDQEKTAKDLDERVTLMELWSKSVLQEMSSVVLWKGYLKFILRSWRDSAKRASEVDGDDEGWSEVFTYDMVVKVVRQAVTSVAYCVPDSHIIWDKYRDLVSLDLEVDSREVKSTKVDYLNSLYIARLSVPHLTLDSTFSSFSSFTSRYQPQENYELIMSEANKIYQQTKKKVEDREPFETRLEQTKDTFEEGQAWSDYLEWEKMVTPKKKLDLQSCLSLYERCTLRYPMESKVWEEYIFFALEKCGNDPRMLSLFERATMHCQWSGALWAHHILALEKRFKPLAAIEAIKHKATESRLLILPEEIFQVHLAWCGVLKRMGLARDAQDNDMDDFAELGLRSTLNEIGQWDPTYRIARMLINFLTQKDNKSGAREEWKKLMKTRSKEYEFWIRYYEWSMVNMDKAFASNVLKQGSSHYKDMDWPEKILETYQTHVQEHSGVDEIEEAEVKVRRLRSLVIQRREAESLVAQQAQQQQERAESVPVTNGEVTTLAINGKRRRSDAQENARPIKRARSEEVDHEMDTAVDEPQETAEQMEARLKQELRESNAKRDREKNTIIVKNLAPDMDELTVRKFFRDCGTINSFHILVEKDGKSSSASIEFASQEDVLAAQTRDGKPLNDRPVVIQVGLGTTVYLTNYPPTADKAWMMDLFKDCGEIVDVRLPSLKFRHHARFCYIQFATSEGAQKATELDGQVVGKTTKGENMKLQAKLSNPAKKQERSGPTKEGREIFITNLDFAAEESDLRELFERWNVESVRVPLKAGGKKRGFGFVVFRTKEQADQALSMDNHAFQSRNIKVVKSETNVPKKAESGTTQAKVEIDSMSVDTSSPAADADTPTSSHTPLPPRPSKEEIAAKTLYVLNVPDTVNDSRVRALFEAHGSVRKVLLKSEHQGAIVEYDNVASAGQAMLALENHELDGKSIKFGTYADLLNSQEAERAKVGENPFSKKKPADQISAASLAPQRVFRPAPAPKKRGGLGFKSSNFTMKPVLGKVTAKDGDVAMKDETPSGDRPVPKSNDQFREMIKK